MFSAWEVSMFEKKFLAIALGASVLIPQLAIEPADAHRVIKRKAAVRTRIVYRDRIVRTQPIVINNYPAAPALAPTAFVPQMVQQPLMVQQPIMVPRVNTYSAINEYPVNYAQPIAAPGHPILSGALGGGVIGGALGAGTGALIGGLSRRHRAGRGALTGLGIGAAAGALLGGLRGASQTQVQTAPMNAGLGSPWF